MSTRILISCAAWLFGGATLATGWAAVGTSRTRWATTTGFNSRIGDDPRAIPSITTPAACPRTARRNDTTVTPQAPAFADGAA